MMLCLRQAGIPIIGFKYPLFGTEIKGEKLDLGTYTKTNEFNQTGYWEVPSIVNYQGITKEYEDIGIKGDAIKITAESIINSDKELIDKVIFMLREPKAIISSMIKCNLGKKEDIQAIALMLYTDITKAIDFLKDKQVKYVSYEELMTGTVRVMNEVCIFLDRGNASWVEGIVDKKLNHYKNLDIEDDNIKKLEDIYNTKIS